MQRDEQALGGQYARAGLAKAILDAFRAAGKDLSTLTRRDLAPIDQFHNGGTWATRKLLALAGLSQGQRVLDVGGGIGGPARTLAAEAGCRVTVVDLTAEHCRTGALLSRLTGLDDAVTYVLGSALALPIADASVDAVWMQNMGMNVADKTRLYAEARRVLRPGGVLALQEVAVGPIRPIRYPVPWAIGPETSFVATPEELRARITEVGLSERVWLDASDLIRSWAMAHIGREPDGPRLPTLPELTMPDDLGCAAIDNMWCNAEERRTVTIWAVAERPVAEKEEPA